MVLQADALTIKQNGKVVVNEVSFTINKDEQWAITGPSGSGKTTLLKALAGKQFFSGHLAIHDNNPALTKRVVLVEQQHHFKNLSNTNNFYYQQRFNSQDAEDAITVEEDLQHALAKNAAAKNELEALAELFDVKKYTQKD